MEIELTDASRERLIILLSEKHRIEQRINDVVGAIADLNNLEKNVEIVINNDCTKLIVNG
jgi:hypothetical protein